jgi:tRNA threonylcarbamoyladenosine biosynthesis protein TsaB
LIVLGIDTTTEVLNLAITKNGVISFDFMMKREGMTHSANLIPTLQNMLKLTEVKLNELEGIAVSIGPGSFTGLRIGLATAKGLAFSLSIPIAGVNALQSYAQRWKELPGILCPLIRARKEEYYFAFYKKSKNNDDLIRIEDYQCMDWFAIKKKLFKFDKPVFIFGYGLTEIIENNETNKYPNNINFIIRKQEPPGAINIALIGEKKILKKENDNIYDLSPFYIRKSGAELKKEEIQKNIFNK